MNGKDLFESKGVIAWVIIYVQTQISVLSHHVLVYHSYIDDTSDNKN